MYLWGICLWLDRDRKEQTLVREYCKEIPEFYYRLKVKAGLTGYAQVYGKYNTTPYDKLKLDLFYIENYSFVLDLKLLYDDSEDILPERSF